MVMACEMSKWNNDIKIATVDPSVHNVKDIGMNILPNVCVVIINGWH